MKFWQLTLMMILLIGVLIALIISSDSVEDSENTISSSAVTNTVTFFCANNQDFVARFRVDDSVELSLAAGDTIRLFKIEGRSESHFENEIGSVVFRPEGSQAWIEQDGSPLYEDCTTTRLNDRPAALATSTQTLVSESLGNYIFNLQAPAKAEISAVGGGDVYRILVAGPNNEPPALTDGYTITLSSHEKATSTSLADFVARVANNEADEGPSNNPKATIYKGRPAFVYTHESELGNKVEELYFELDVTTVINIATSIVGQNEGVYQSAIANLFDTLEFIKG